MGRIKRKILLNAAEASILLGLSENATRKLMDDRSLISVNISGSLFTNRKAIKQYVKSLFKECADGTKNNTKRATGFKIRQIETNPKDSRPSTGRRNAKAL